MKISCLIHTRNSELFLREVLRSVSWCDEIVIVDMESNDLTLSIATEFNCKIINHKNIGYADPARQFGLEQASHPWILAIDSDEIVPEKLALQLKKIVSNDSADAVQLCFRNFFFGKELKGTGWSYKNLKVFRFFKRGFISYNKDVHSFIQVSSEARKFSLINFDFAIIHFNYLDVSHFIQKLDRYTNFEAQKPATKNFISQGLYQILRELGGRFIILGGWRDGWIGFYLSFAMAFYRITSITKQHTPDTLNIIKDYKQIATKTPVLIVPSQNNHAN